MTALLTYANLAHILGVTVVAGHSRQPPFAHTVAVLPWCRLIR